MQMVTAAVKFKDSYSLRRTVMSNLDSILRSRDITLPAKVPLVKAMVFMSLKSGSDNTMSAYNAGDWVVKTSWTRKWQPSPIFFLVKSHGCRSLIGYSPWGHRVGLDWVTSLLHFMFFPVAMYGRESWTIRKAEHRRIDAFFFLFKIYLFSSFLPCQAAYGILVPSQGIEPSAVKAESLKNWITRKILTKTRLRHALRYFIFLKFTLSFFSI